MLHAVPDNQSPISDRARADELLDQAIDKLTECFVAREAAGMDDIHEFFSLAEAHSRMVRVHGASERDAG